MSFKYCKVHFGPDNTCHNLIHKPQRLHGLKNHLQKLGFRVDCFMVPYINYCVLEVCGHEVFRCNITNLKFNTHRKRDPVCQRAIEAVINASNKFKLARTHFWISGYIDHQIFRRGEYSPKNYWPVDVDVQHFASCQDCVACCGILVSRKTDEELAESRDPLRNLALPSCDDFKLQ